MGSQNTPRRAPTGGYFRMLPFVLVACFALAACLAFGSPTLWMTNEEAAMMQPSNTQPAPVAPVPTEKTEEMVFVSEYKAISQSDDSRRATNLRLAAEAIDGQVIMPGETFSFNKVVGDTENDERYEYAHVASGDTMVEGRGGGICQVSTALYIAALKADLEITERHPHSLVSDYAPIGLDATLVYGLMDLRITNNSEHPYKIAAESVGQTVDVKLYGHSLDPGISIDAISKITERFDGTQEPSSAGGSAGDGNIVYVSESYRVYYKNGVKTESELLSRDSYIVPDTSAVQLAEGGFDPTK